MFRFIRQRARRRILENPFPDAWRQSLEQHVPYYHLLLHHERESLHSHIQILTTEKRFVGCNGLELTDDMQVIIAGQAALLMLTRDFDYFPRLGSVLVYPTDFVINQEEETEWGMVSEEEIVHTGESWTIGAVVLSWREVQRDTARGDGRNVVLHEFAHQIDQADGASDGWPVELERDVRDRWHDVMLREYETLCDRVEARRRTVIDPYGATHPAEFFAVVTEMFFLEPHELRRHHPELYDLFRAFYAQDPTTRFPAP
jgi:Mlc titration factor MtfA (ptsG expression regulator)